MSIDLLVFGPHPDDLELGLGGTIARHVAEGYTVGLCDLTAGELGSNGTPEERVGEALQAAHVLGAKWRENLGWPDGDLVATAERVHSAVELIRKHRPRTVAVPYWQDRHPDHVASSQTLDQAIFRGGLRRHVAGGDAWKPDWVCYYFINNAATPSFIVDVSEYYEVKQRALACHQSQFTTSAHGAVPTRLTTDAFRRLIESRDAQFGAQIGVRFAEGLVVREPLVRSTLFKAQP